LNNTNVGATATSGAAAGVTVTNKSSGSGVDFNFTIPTGEQGIQGEQGATGSVSTVISKTAHAAGANDRHFELYSDNTGDPNKEVSLRFHQGNQYWGQIRFRSSQFYFKDGYANTPYAINTGVVNATGSITCTNTDDSVAQISAYGSSQGTGRLYVGQSGSYGGGIEYNGDNSPVSTGAGADYITLYRVNNGAYNWTARNSYASNNWEFRGNVGIGKNPGYPLDVAGTARADSFEADTEFKTVYSTVVKHGGVLAMDEFTWRRAVRPPAIFWVYCLDSSSERSLRERVSCR
jgi:hypothetical protein